MGVFLEWMLESSLLVLMVLGIRKFFTGKIRYAAIYSLWMIVLLRFMIPVNFISTPVSVANLFPRIFSAGNDTDAMSAGTGSVTDGRGKGGAIKTEGLETKTVSDGYSLAQSADAGHTDKLSQAVSGGMFRPSAVFWHTVFRYGRWVAAILLLGWFWASNASLLRSMKAERRFYGRRGPVTIYTVSHLQTPCLYGFFKPAIYLPAFLVAPESDRRVSAEELRQMITHEYVHYCHKDHIWAMVRMFVVSLHWYDPFVWIAAAYSKRDAELFCDETVIRMLGEENRFQYGRMLVRLAGNSSWGDFRYSMMLMSRRGREMEQRIRAISGNRRYSRWMLLPLAAALAAAVVITCSSGTWGLTGRDTGAEASAQTQMVQAQGSAADSQSAQYASSYEEAFDRYIEVFTRAVNTGSTEELDQVLLPGSGVYEQQCAIVRNYHKRGIREEVIRYAIPSAIKRTGDCVGVDSSEEIQVYYGDGTSKVVKQRYRYTCEYIGQGWIITGMDEIV